MDALEPQVEALSFDEMIEGEDTDPALVYEYIAKDGTAGLLEGSELERTVAQLIGAYTKFETVRNTEMKPVWRAVDRVLNPEYDKLTDDQKRFKGTLPYARQTLNTLKAHLWAKCIANDKDLFSVQGKNDEAKENQVLYKQALLEVFKYGKLKQRLDDAADELITKGIFVGFVSRMVKHKKMRVLSGQMGTEPMLGEDGQRLAGEEAFVEKETKVCETAELKVLKLTDFVFDPDMYDQWDECFKAFRAPTTYEDIAANKANKGYQELKKTKQEAANSAGKDSIYSKKTEESKDVSGFYADGRIEVIEIYGDIRLPNGDYLENWCAVIAGRKHLIRFETNPFYINPFVRMVYEKSDHGWGQGGPIAQVVGLIQGASQALRNGVDATAFAINPAYMTPTGMIQAKTTSLNPGEHVEYVPNVTTPNAMPQPIPINPAPAFPLIQLFEGQTEATTGATRQLSGNVTTNDKAQTATEFTGLQVIGNLQVDRVTDLFNIAKIEAIEKMATFQAMYNPEPLEVAVDQEDGQQEFKKIGVEVYYQPFDFIVEDTKSELARKQATQEAISFLQATQANPYLAARTDWIKVSCDVWRDLGFGSANKYYYNDTDFVVHQAKELGIQAMAQQLAMQAAQNLGVAPELQQAMQQIGMPDNGAEQGLPTEGFQEPTEFPSMGGVQSYSGEPLPEQFAGDEASLEQGLPYGG